MSLLELVLRPSQYTKFFAWIVLPISITATVVSLFLKPRREDRIYKAFLYFQFVCTWFGSEFFIMAGDDWETGEIVKGCIRALGYTFVFYVFLRIRANAAKLSDEALEDFLASKVMKGGLTVGLGQIVFLAFSSIQCYSEANQNGDEWYECKRSLWSQTGLGGMIAGVTIVLLVGGIAPPKYIERHTPKIQKIASMDLNRGEKIQLFWLIVACGCGLFM